MLCLKNVFIVYFNIIIRLISNKQLLNQFKIVKIFKIFTVLNDNLRNISAISTFVFNGFFNKIIIKSFRKVLEKGNYKLLTCNAPSKVIELFNNIVNFSDHCPYFLKPSFR